MKRGSVERNHQWLNFLRFNYGRTPIWLTQGISLTRSMVFICDYRCSCGGQPGISRFEMTTSGCVEKISDIKSARHLIAEFCQCDGNWITQGRLTFEYEQAKKRARTQSERAKYRWGHDKNYATTTTTTTTEEVKKVPDARASGRPFFSCPRGTRSAGTGRRTALGQNFREGRTILVSMGVSEKQSGAVIGKWRKQNPDAEGILSRANLRIRKRCG